MKLLLYCTKGKPYLIGGYHKPYYLDKGGKYAVMDARDNILNGKIVAECDFEVEEIKIIDPVGKWFCYENQYEIMEKSKLDVNKFFDYLQGKNCYAIHIKNLKIFDKPRELKDFYRAESIDGHSPCWHCKRFGSGCHSCSINAPQNMMYVYDVTEKKVLISIHPEWLCKILNGEKTIEVRKKVLKEMQQGLITEEEYNKAKEQL